MWPSFLVEVKYRGSLQRESTRQTIATSRIYILALAVARVSPNFNQRNERQRFLFSVLIYVFAIQGNMCANLAIDLRLNEQNERPSCLNDARNNDLETDGGGTVAESDSHLRQTRQDVRNKDKSAMDKPCECHVEKTTPPPTTGYLTKETFKLYNKL